MPEIKTRFPLPAWAEAHPTEYDTILVDPDKAYPAILEELGVAPAQRSKYWLEVAYQFMKMDLQTALGRFGFVIHIRADDGRKDRWALTAFPGTQADVDRATKGREAREVYRRIRGSLP